MRRSLRLAAWVALSSLLACSTASPVPADLGRLVADAPEQSTTRLWLQGDRIVRAAVGLGPGSMPPAVRKTIEVVAPQGELLFQGREWGPRGAGFRIDKRYREGPDEHIRSALIADDGRVLERSHSVPLPKVPRLVLTAAMQGMGKVEEASIVSGPEIEESWRCTVRDRMGHTLVLTIGLDGAVQGTWRRVAASLDV